MKSIAISILILLIGLGGYFGYKYYSNVEAIDIWDLLPNNAVAVYECSDLNAMFVEIDSSLLLKNISPIDGKELSVSLVDLNVLNSVFDNTHTLISVHITSNHSLDVLYLLDLSNNDKEKSLQLYLDEISNNNAVIYSERKYKGVDIHEVENNSEKYSYVFYKGIFIISKTSFLVEDAIRTVLDSELSSIRDSKPELFTIPKLKKDNGNIYINGDKLNEIINIFIEEEISYPFLKSVFYDLTIDKNRLLLNGFAYEKSNAGLYNLNKQRPVAINVFDYVPNDVLYLYHVGLSNPVEWLRNVRNKIDSLSLERLEKWVGSEVAIFDIAEDNDISDKVLLIKSIDINEALNHINVLAEENIDKKTDSLYFEIYADFEIKELNVKEFPFQAFGKEFNGFDQSFYFILKDYVVMSNSIYALKRMLDSIEDEKTWGRSIKENHFLESTLKEANVSLYFNAPRVWDKLLGDMDASWVKKFELMNFKSSISNGAIQFSNVDDKFYSSIVLELVDSKEENIGAEYVIEHKTFFDAKIITKPFIVKNHKDYSFETLLQDSLTQLYLVDSKGIILWKDSIGDVIRGKVHQIDFYKNKKLQYFFATKNTLHLIDRNGDYVEGFPKTLNVPIEQLSVIDYDNSKNYRFIVEDGLGNIYIYDKNLINLEGWMPRKVGGKLSEAVKHVRVRGRDYMIAVQKNGIINVMNRKGVNEEGFPLKLDMNIDSEMAISIGSNSNTTKITIISVEGQLLTFNLMGEVVERKELYKPSKETKFKMVVSNSKSFVIYRVNNNRLTIIDIEDDLIFEKDYLKANITSVQNYNFGSGNEFFAINIKNQNFTYLYNINGELMNSTPLNSNFKIGVIDYSNSLGKTFVYTCYDNQLTIYSLD